MNEFSSASGSSQRALIVVVERDAHIQQLERYFLEQAGYEVAFAEDGEQALQMARALKPRILITEILLTGIDGLGLCSRIKAEPETRSIAVLVFSILSAEDRAREAGADAFLKKPLDDTLLVRTVARLLARYRQGAPLHEAR